MTGMHTRLSASWGILLRGPGFRAEERQAKAKARDLLAFVGLSEAADTRAGDLPYGDQARLEIARALACEPRLVLLDEPAAGMNPPRPMPPRPPEPPARRARPDPAAGRARHAPGDESLRPPDGPELRPPDRRRYASRGARPPAVIEAYLGTGGHEVSVSRGLGS